MLLSYMYELQAAKPIHLEALGLHIVEWSSLPAKDNSAMCKGAFRKLPISFQYGGVVRFKECALILQEMCI